MRDAIGGPNLFNIEEKNKYKAEAAAEYIGVHKQNNDLTVLEDLFYTEYIERKKEYHKQKMV